MKAQDEVIIGQTLPSVWVAFAVKYVNGVVERCVMVKVWRKPITSSGNYAKCPAIYSSPLMHIYEPGSWRNSCATPGCPMGVDYAGGEWFLVLVLR